MKPTRNSTVIAFIVGLLVAGSAPAQHAPAPSLPPRELPSPDGVDAPLQLPVMKVTGERLSDYPLIPRKDLSGGGLAPSEPPVNLSFPGSAYAAGIPKGYATVCVELDEKGNATDYLLIAYTEKYFGDALLRAAKDTKYSPLLVRGVAVPSRFNFGYEFRPEFTVPIGSFDAIEHRQLEIRGGRPVFKYQPASAAELDEPLERIREAVPFFPEGYTPTGTKADWVMVSCYIDEQGQVRAPSVASASSPLLIRNALKAVHYWQFKPPTVKGKPVLVFAAFAVNFVRAGG